MLQISTSCLSFKPNVPPRTCANVDWTMPIWIIISAQLPLIILDCQFCNSNWRNRFVLLRVVRLDVIQASSLTGGCVDDMRKMLHYDPYRISNSGRFMRIKRRMRFIGYIPSARKSHVIHIISGLLNLAMCSASVPLCRKR